MLFMNWLTDLIGGLGSVINNLLTWLFFLIGKWLYPFISYLYSLFEILVKGRLLDNNIMKTLSSRIGLLLGIVMFFMIIVNVIQMLVDPDKVSDKEKGAGSILFRVVVVLIMFGLSSFSFNSLYYIQKVVVDSNVIGRIFVPSDIQTNDFGDYLSYKLFLSFYTINPEADANDFMVTTCKDNLEQLQLDIYNNKDYSLAEYCLDKKDANDINVINFNAILAIGAAIFCIYFLFSYCITIGVRMILLTFLEIISPMAFVSYLSPKKDNMFSKWLKLYFSTFIDSFIRIAIIHFAIYMIYLVLGDLSDGSAFASTVMDNQFVNGNDDTKVFIYTIMVFAILTFAKKAPDLIKDLFPSSSKLGFGVTTPKQLFDGMLGGNLVRGGLTTGAKVATAGAALGIGGAIMSGASRFNINKKNGKHGKDLVMGTVGGVFGGFRRGLVAGSQKGNVFSNISKGIKNQREIDDKYDDLITSGGSIPGKIGSQLVSHFGETKGQMFTRYLGNLEKLESFEKDMKTRADEISFVKSAKDEWEHIVQYEGESSEDFTRRRSNAYAKYKALQKAAIDISGSVKGKEKIETKYDEKVMEAVYKLNDKGERVVDEKGDYIIDHYEEVERKVSISANFDGGDDVIHAGDITATVAQASDYSVSHNVEVWDESKETYVKVGPISNREELATANKKGQVTKTHIMRSGEYSKAIANDKAAGVNSNGSK